MTTPLDQHGQPLNSFFGSARNLARDTEELIGIVKGILFDGMVTDDEARAFDRWMDANPNVRLNYPGEIFAKRLKAIFADGKISDDERKDLHETMLELVGGKLFVMTGENFSSTLPLDKPAPPISFQGSVFVFTGKFAMGPRAQCQRLTIDLGGVCEDRITKQTRYLVVGMFSSRDWVHTSEGRKIEKARELRDFGIPLAIVGEDHWANHLSRV